MLLTSRQKEILESAIDLISAKGIQGLTTKNLAAELGCSEPALYRHFSGKQEIVRSLLLYFNSAITELMDINYPASTVIEEIEKTFLNLLEAFNRKPTLVSVIFSESTFHGDPDVSKELYAFMLKNRTRMTEIVRRGVADGSIRRDVSPEYIAMVITGAMRFLLANWRLSNFSFDLVSEGRVILANTIIILRPLSI